MSNYEATLAEARKAGASNATDAGVMALFCASSLQTLVGAVSPSLVWEGAQAKGMTARELAHLATRDAFAVSELMWS